VKSGSIALIEIEAPWSFLKGQSVRVLVQDVDLSLETRVLDDDVAADVSDEAKRGMLNADLEDLRWKLSTSEEERAHWLSLFVTAILSKVEVTVKDVKMRIVDAASKGGSRAGSSCCFGLQLDLLQLVSSDG